MSESAKPSASPPVNPLQFSDVEAQVLLQQVSQLGQHQVALEQQADDYHQAYMAALGSAERELINLKLQQLQQWLGHLSSNQLEPFQRHQLASWILKDSQALGEHGLADAKPINLLIHKLARQLLILAQQDTIPSHATLTQLRQVLAVLLEQEYPVSTDQILNLIASPDTLTDWLELCRQEAEAEKRIGAGASDESWQNLAALILRDKTMHKLVKRLALQLHPDKEQDELRKQQKQVLMQRLLRAKKRHDLGAILSLYQQYAKQNVQIDLTMSQAIIKALAQQGKAYSQTYQQTLQANTPKMWVWRRFSQGEQSLTTQLQQANIEIQREQVKLTQALQQGSQVEVIKQALQQQA